uniref:nitroreductase family protein n=1 Tax=Castellaniella defragrans TaxID=75697 RepID=UPI00333F40E6
MNSDTLNTLLSRRSIKFVQAPGPTDEQLDLILRAAMCAPDHGAVRPWRFALVRGADVPALVDVALQAGEAAGTPLPAEKAANARKWLSRVPLVVAIACARDHDGRISDHERILATGTAVGNMLNAAHALGLGAFWSTGVGTYIDGVGDALGFDALDYCFMGYLSIGTPIEPGAVVARPDYRDFVSEWHAA